MVEIGLYLQALGYIWTSVLMADYSENTGQYERYPIQSHGVSLSDDGVITLIIS